MKDIKLGLKIGAGFTILALIAVLLGFSGIYNMKKVQKDSLALSEQYIPEVEISDNIKRSSLLAMYAYRGYNYTKRQDYLEEGKRRLDLAREGLAQAKALTAKYPGLVMLKEGIPYTENRIERYIDLSIETENALNLQTELIKEQEIAVSSFVKEIRDFLASQNFEAKTLINTGKLSAEVMTERLIKINSGNEILNLCYASRIKFLSAMEKIDKLLMQETLIFFDKIYEQLDLMEGITYQDINLQRLAKVRKAASDYQKSVETSIKSWENMLDVNDTRTKIGLETLDATENIAKAGLNQTKLRSDLAVNNLARASRIMSIALFIGLAAALITSVFLTRAITQPIYKSVNFAKEISEGNLQNTIDIKQKDEIGVLAENLQNMSDKLREVVREIQDSSNNVASGSTELATISEQMASSTNQSTSMTNDMGRTISEVNDSMHSISAAMEEASVNINTVATAAEEMSATINEIAQNSERAKNITLNAVTKSQATSDRVGELEKAAREISAVTEAITNISSQTNLLALNATIEAARAGEAGRGFAVVANEIKELALQTTRAAEDIREKIDGIQSVSKVTIDEISDITSIVDEMNDIVSGIAAAVEEQSVTTRDIAENVNQASLGISEINENVGRSSLMVQNMNNDIEQVKLASEEINSGSKGVQESSIELSRLAENLRRLVAYFRI